MWTEVGVHKAGKWTRLVLHWNGRRWIRIGPANPGYYLAGAVPDGHGGWWSAGYSPPANPAKPSLFHRAGNRWSPVAIPIQRGDSMHVNGNYTGSILIHVPGTRPVALVGQIGNVDGVTGLVISNGSLPG